MSFEQIKEELKDYDHDVKYKLFIEAVEERHFEVPMLPGECVNLKDALQMEYFKDYPAVQIANKYCETRRLFTAYNAPKTYYCCLNDRFHGNRLIIPYYNEKGKIDCYISRKLLDGDDRAKYLMKFGSKKPIFNLAKVDESYPYLFLFEGQIDSLFVKNGISVAGVYLTEDQDAELTKLFPFHERIWVLDNYRFEAEEVREIIIKKMKNREMIFLYNGAFEEFKDLNEYCVKKEQDQIDPALILQSCYTGDKGLLKLS